MNKSDKTTNKGKRAAISTPIFLRLQEATLKAKSQEDLIKICEWLWMTREEFLEITEKKFWKWYNPYKS